MRRSVLLLSLCVAIVGCDKAEDGVDAEVGAYSLFDPAAVNPALCGGAAIPFPNNALFASAASASGVTTDTTLNIPSTSPTALAANLTDGFSTTASAFTDVLGSVDLASAADGIIVLEADASPRILSPVTDYRLQTSTAMAQLSGTGGGPLTMPSCTSNPGAAKFLPISHQRTRILIEPLKPLNPSTNYIIVVTNALKSSDGVPVTTNEFFPIVNRDTRLCRLAPGGVPEAGTEILCGDPAAPATLAASIHPVLGTVFAPALNPNGDPNAPLGSATTPTAAAFRLTTLETLRRSLVRPTVLGFNQLRTALSLPTIADEDIVIAWSFTTQSIGASLQTLNAIAAAKTFTVVNSGLTTGALGFANSATIWAGTFNAVPYYLDDASSTSDAASQGGFWLNNGTVTSPAAGGFVPWTPLADYDADVGTPNTPAPCTLGPVPGGPQFNWVAPTSTTNCHRIPLERSQESLPVIITVPITAKPTNGWPVVIFQHGITGHRGQMIPIGARYGTEGMVTIAIDLPLHGILAGDPTFGTLRQAGNERTFDLNLVSQTVLANGTCVTTANAPDANTDCSGTHFINLASLITSRDNLRQAAADLIHLSKSLGDSNLNFDGIAGNDIDLSQVHFSGISLGSIVGTTFLGVDTGANATADGSDELITAASLNVPGGGLGKLLDASASFGPVIAAGLAGSAFSGAGTNGVSSPFEGTDTYETFVRFAQHLTDPGDPINYAVSANANHRIHMTMVENDTVVPNSAFSTCTTPIPLGTSVTAANNTLDATRGAACDAGVLLVGTNSITQALCNDTVLAVGICAGNAAQDETLITGYLSGTEPLYGEMGLAVTGPITPPGTAANQTNANGIDTLVHFAVGAHSSLLSPAASAAVTCEMQRQTAVYLKNNGTSLPVGGTCP